MTVELRKHPNYKIRYVINRLYVIVQQKKDPNDALVTTLKLLAGLISFFVLLLEFCDPADQNLTPIWKIILEYLNANRFRLVASMVALLCFLYFSDWLYKRITPVEYNSVKEILDYAVQHHFQVETQDHQKFNYRATLFKKRNFLFLGSWLGIVCRSGHQYEKSTTIFSVDSMNRLHNTGFCGECYWRSGNTISTPNAINSNEKKPYIENGYIAEKEYCNMNVKAEIFYATGIKVNGRIWGILVLDTNDPNQLPGPNVRSRFESDMNHWALAVTPLVRS